jgi:hypothetical protein
VLHESVLSFSKCLINIRRVKILVISTHQSVHTSNLFEIGSSHAHENLVVIVLICLNSLANVVHLDRRQLVVLIEVEYLGERFELFC